MRKLLSVLLVLVLVGALCITVYAATDSDHAQFEGGKTVTICFGIGALIGLVVVLVLKSQLKTVHYRSGADCYVGEGRLNLTAQSDVFCYQTVTRHERPRQDHKK